MNIRCPQCDALLEVGTEYILTKCPYCGVQLFYSKDGFITKEAIKPTHDSSVAKNLLKSIVGKYLKVSMGYFPFYRISSKGKTHFFPGKAVDLYGVNRYVPQGDRVPLDLDVEEPEFSIDEVLNEAGIEEADSIGIIYLPFFTAHDNDNIYCVDGATGNILSNKLLDRRKLSTNKHPLAILSWLIVSLLILLFPLNLILKIIIAISIITGFWFYEGRGGNA